MGNTASTASYARSADFTTSDRLLDQMEKQECVTTTSGWMETVAYFCAVMLSTMAALLVGNLTGSLDQRTKTPILVDSACQTEDEDFIELAVRNDWQLCHSDKKNIAGDDCHSCTTEMTDLFTDTECEDEMQNETDSEWESVSSASDDVLYAICDACESCNDCDCETQAEQLLRLTAIVCTEDNDDSRIYLEDYLCTCGECPQYGEIARAVATRTETAKTSLRKVQQRQSVTRLLQAFSTYNEVLGYRPDMIPAAYECLRTWNGDEDKAFKSFVTLYDDVPQLCDANSHV
ncbi:N-acetyltransferase san [Phytophthora cinnamomi]|uniref:N-acetyltransferase san n=1 Tax=Phytophthora cinnamomi TaxID=4785 RepID=UPI00355AB88A|nr:N-acetyltransferase san [Phytophthora cinnamomi]